MSRHKKKTILIYGQCRECSAPVKSYRQLLDFQITIIFAEKTIKQDKS